jgi:hypothetical protein
MENGLIIIITSLISVYLHADSTVWWQYRFNSNKENYVKIKEETRSKI